jgi:hypothetical protein
MASELERLYFSANTITLDFFNLVCSEKLGTGVAREVFRSAFDPNIVFKFEKDAGSFQNIIEWETWQNVRFTEGMKTDYAQYFAPCLAISPCGTILAQAAARPLDHTELPEYIPSFFTDIKKDNFGIINGKVVCIDYGNNLLMTLGLNKKKRKAEWL